MKWLELTLGEWNLLLLQRDRRSSTCLDPPPSWVMLVVDKENGLHEILYVEFLSRIMHMSHFAHVNLIEDFPQNSLCMIHSSINMSVGTLFHVIVVPSQVSISFSSLQRNIIY